MTQTLYLFKGVCKPQSFPSGVPGHDLSGYAVHFFGLAGRRYNLKIIPIAVYSFWIRVCLGVAQLDKPHTVLRGLGKTRAPTWE